jgi:hypothetical protein
MEDPTSTLRHLAKCLRETSWNGQSDLPSVTRKRGASETFAKLVKRATKREKGK